MSTSYMSLNFFLYGSYFGIFNALGFITPGKILFCSFAYDHTSRFNCHNLKTQTIIAAEQRMATKLSKLVVFSLFHVGYLNKNDFYRAFLTIQVMTPLVKVAFMWFVTRFLLR